MPRVQTIAPTQVQSTARCPICQNWVYADGLKPITPYIDGSGRKRYAELVIDCDSCGKTSTVEYHGF